MVYQSPDSERASLHPFTAFFRTIAERQRLRDRLRLFRGRRLASQGGNVEVWEDDVHPVDPSGDESIPAESQDEPLNVLTYFSLPPSSR